MLSIWGFCKALKGIVDNDVVLKRLAVQGAYYQIAPGGVTGEFVVHQMQSGTFDRTLGGVQDLRFVWQLCAMAGDRDGVSPIQRADLISMRLFEMLDGGEDDGNIGQQVQQALADMNLQYTAPPVRGENLLSGALTPYGYYCEYSRATGFYTPRYQQVSGVQKWKCGLFWEWMLEPLG